MSTQPEDEGSPGKNIVGEVQEPELHGGPLSGLERLALLDGQHLRRLPQHSAVNHRLIAAADGGGVVENHLQYCIECVSSWLLSRPIFMLTLGGNTKVR